MAMVVVSALFGVLVATKFVLPDLLGEQHGRPGTLALQTTRKASCSGFSATLSLPFCITLYRGLRSGPFSAAGLDGGCRDLEFLRRPAGMGSGLRGFGQPLEWAEFPLIVACLWCSASSLRSFSL